MGRVDALIRQLDSWKDSEQHEAINALARLGDPKAVPALHQTLNKSHESLYIRAAAAWAIGQIGDLNIVPELLDALESGHYDYGYFPETILEAIDSILGRTSPDNEKSRAVYSRVVDKLIQLIHEDPRTQIFFLRATGVAEALGRTRDPKAIPVLIEQLREDKPTSIAIAAARALRYFNNPIVIQALTQTASNKNISASVREAAAKSLRDIGNPETKRRMATVDKLIRQLQSEDAKTRRKAAIALGQIDDPRVFFPLIRTIDDSFVIHDNYEDTDVRIAAARSIGQIGSANIVTDLFFVFDRCGKALKKPILDAIYAVYSRTSPDDEQTRAGIFDALIQGLEDESKSDFSRAEIARALARIGNPKAIEPLIGILENKQEDIELRKVAIDALCTFREQRVIDALIRGFRDVNIARAAVEALKKLRDKRAVEPLIRIFECKDGIRESDYERALAVEVLGAIDDPRAVPILVKALRDKYERVRMYAFEAIPPFIPTHPDAILRLPPEDRNLLGRLIQETQNDELLRELCKKSRRKTRR